MSTDKQSIDWYNQNAQHYTDHVRNPDDSIYHSLYEKPAMYGLLPDLQDKSVVSLGCGSGEDCEFLRSCGASKVVGIDISESMIGFAKNSYPECDFAVMDMENLAFENESFDFAYSSLAVHYIEDWTKLFADTHRVLKPGGSFLFSCNHPVYSALETSRNDDDMKVRELSRTLDKKTDSATIVGNYTKRRPVTLDTGMAVTTWHKSIGEITHEATSAGFVITDILEPQPLPAMEKVAPKDYETLTKIPNFIVFKLQKL
ncbi:MAG: class I SAM-dependent methyltransferase [Patescibacteria group bacterium]|nr:class I SAM-dependent methyltransferase [Patescibacteria group bacterium]